jgi:arsenate reductase (thioredoxin)
MTYSRKPPLKILFVCIGNACRSQMAEGFAHRLGRRRVHAHSAGSHPLGLIAADTHTVMNEKGISIDEQCSKGLHDVALSDMDVVVTMGHEVDCPVPEGFKGQVVHWDIPDPYARGIESFRSVRDMVEQHVQALLDDILIPKSVA